MKFFELAVGDHFKYGGGPVVHVKVKEERISCCKVGKNAIVYGVEDSKVVVSPLEEVEKVVVASPEGHIAPAKTEEPK